MKKFKYIISLAVVLSLLLSNSFAFAFYAPPTNPSSDAALLIDIDSGTVIYQKNADKKMFPASLTKIMTAIIALEYYKGKNLDDIILNVKSSALDDLFGTGATSADLKIGEDLTLKDALYSLLLQSACDSANVIAQSISGDIYSFVNKMNEKAKKIGAKNTHFVNAHGLHDDNQYTTAKDMAIITKYALTLPLFAEISSTPKYEMRVTNKHPAPRFAYHTNLMLDKLRGGKYYYPYIKGIKTGTTDNAGKNLVSMASKDGYNYLLVLMGAPYLTSTGEKLPDNLSFIDAKNIYSWAFSSLATKTIITKDQIITEVKVNYSWSTDHIILVPKNDVSTIVPSKLDIKTLKQELIGVPKSVDAPLNKNQVLGKVQYKLGNDIVATVDLVPNKAVEKSILLYTLHLAGEFLPFILVGLALLIGLIVVYVIAMIRINKKKRATNKN